MKTLTKVILWVVLSAFPCSVFSQKAETVHSFARVLKDLDWYKEQARLWKNEIDNKTTNAEAWVNFYKANRAIERYFGIDPGKQQEEYLVPMAQIVEKAEKAIPHTFELNFIKSEDRFYDEEGIACLLQAQKMRPYDPLLIPSLMTYYAINNDKKNIRVVSQKWYDSNEMAIEFLATGYNMLMSLDDNAIILVYGDNDTYPIWILQNVLNVRTDVTAVNMMMAQIDKYRQWFFKENSIPEFTVNENEMKTVPALIHHVVRNVKTRPVYISPFADKNIYAGFSDKLYMTGLALKYSEKAFDNIAVLKNNIENKFLLDFLKITLQNSISESLIAKMNLGYVAPFLRLYEHYRLSNETVKMKNIKSMAQTISEKAGVPEWMQYFE
ncbi:MAG: hypothetical protein LBQ60_07930 [Bacteroidales bacterium]|jgi:hypothetical protein|nr:hypothetical protein [Bacteroidales bacterium]